MDDETLAPYVPGSTEPWSVSVLCALTWLTRACDVLELGAFEGRTTEKLAETLEGAPTRFPNLVAVEVDGPRAEVARNRCARFPHVRVVERDAIPFLRECLVEGLSFDVAFVDDDHTYAHVAEEIDLLKSGVVRRGGIIVMHDVLGEFELAPLVHLHDGFIIDLPLMHAAGGLGVIRV